MKSIKQIMEEGGYIELDLDGYRQLGYHKGVRIIDCESDEEVLQVIPYVLLFDESKKIFTYIRASDIKDYGDERLFGKQWM